MSNVMGTSNALLNIAFTHHREGRLAEAEALYRQVLELDSGQPFALSMLGLILMGGDKQAEAESVFLRHLEVDPGNPLTQHSLGRLLQIKGNDRDAIELFRRACAGKHDLAPIFNDLAVSLHRLGQWDEALVELDQALRIDPCFAMAHDNRGVVLYDLGRFRQAMEAHQAALEYMSIDRVSERIAVLRHLAKAGYESADMAVAEQACRAILESDASNTVAIEYLAKVLYRLGRENEALYLLNRHVGNQGLTRKSQTDHPEATILVIGAVGASHVPTGDLFDSGQFATMTMTLLSPDQPDAPLGSISYEALTEADLVFNTLGEVERYGGQVEFVESLLQRLGKPILNPPSSVAVTGRDQAHALFGNIPGLLVPDVRWTTREELVALSHVDKSFLIRPGGTHGGEDLALIKTSVDILAYLAKVPYDRFLMTDFHDFKDRQNFYRKYRFIFIDREPFPYHLAISESWLVHYWRAEMGHSNWKKEEEGNFLTDWKRVFGPKAAATVEQVAQNMDLDYGGLDCSLLPSGEVLFFEANANMLLHIDDQEVGFPFKNQAVSNIRDAMSRLVRSRVLQTGEII